MRKISSNTDLEETNYVETSSVQGVQQKRKLPPRREKLDRIYIFGPWTLQSTESFPAIEPRYVIGPLFEIVTTVVFH